SLHGYRDLNGRSKSFYINAKGDFKASGPEGTVSWNKLAHSPPDFWTNRNRICTFNVLIFTRLTKCKFNR
ncbi:MAG: hypothetical protein P8X42_15460, partial [Calditrichaceae bacterium]